jgi:hypothetical protein
VSWNRHPSAMLRAYFPRDQALAGTGRKLPDGK